MIGEGYKYEKEKPELFTEGGQKHFLKIRDKVRDLLSVAGSFKMEKIHNMAGNNWQNIACVDRLVELGEIRELKRECAGQERVFENGTLLKDYRSKFY